MTLFGQDPPLKGGLINAMGDRKKAGEIVEIVQNQKDGRQISPSRSPLKDLSVCGEVGDLTAVSDGYGKSDAHLPRFFSVSKSSARTESRSQRDAYSRP